MRTFLNGADRLLRPIENLMALVAGLVVLALMAIGCAEVISRSFFNSPIHGHLDIVEQLMVPVAAFGIAYCQSIFGNIRMTLLFQDVRGSPKWLLELLTLTVAGFVVFVLMTGSFRYFQRAWSLGGDTPEIGIPIWIGILGVTASLALLLMRILLQSAEAIRLLVDPSDSSNIFRTAEDSDGMETK